MEDGRWKMEDGRWKIVVQNRKFQISTIKIGIWNSIGILFLIFW